jgi:trimethylamine--corrinoid protein Co-methyltransferase
LEGGLSASYEKIIVDAELIRHWAGILQPMEFTDDDLGFEAIREVPPGGHHFGTAHTLARYQRAFYRPLLSDWSGFEAWQEAGSRTATDRASALWPQLLAEYVPPPLDAARRDAIDDYINRCVRGDRP